MLATSYAGPVGTTYQQQQHTAYQMGEDWFRDREWISTSSALTLSPPGPIGAIATSGSTTPGGVDANYMFNRYLGFGAEGYALSADDAIGQASGNLIFRYPIPGTRFAPYGHAGGGVIFNGSRVEDLVDRGRSFRSIRRHGDAEGMGQFGAGLEFRFTPDIGLINDFSWNVINGDENDFEMVRGGVRFAF
jgi:hypothetical protein